MMPKLLIAVLCLLLTFSCVASTPTPPPAPTPTPDVIPTPSPTPTPTPVGMLVGQWIDQLTSSIQNRIGIFETTSGQSYMTNEYSDGSELTLDLRETESSVGRRFDVADSATGDYFVIDAQGDLQIWDSQGLIRTAKKDG